MRLSLVIPTYNRSGLLIRALESVVASCQHAGKTPIETIVVDDGSTDETADIVKEGVQCTRLVRQSNAGPGAARNAGAALATGDYLAFLDSDDLWLPWTLRVLGQLLTEPDAPSLLASMPRVFRAYHEIAGWAQGGLLADRYADYLSSDPVDIFPGAGSMVVRRDLFAACGGFTTERVGAEDADVFLRLGCVPGFVFVRQPVLVAYRTHGGSFSLDVGAGMAGRWAMLRAEREGRYPGGEPRRDARRRVITSHCRSATVVGARTGRIGEACRLYGATAWWHVREGRWKYLAGFPLVAAKAVLAGGGGGGGASRLAARQGFLPAPAVETGSDVTGHVDGARAGKPRVAVVFATRNRREELRRALESCAKQTVPVRVIVRDDASDDGTEAMVRSVFPHVEYGRHPQPRGSIANRNEAVNAAEGVDIVFSLDDDAAFDSPRTVEQTLRDFDDPRVGVVAVPFVDVLKGSVVEQGAPKGGGDGVFVLDTFRGCAAAWRRDAFLAVGGYAECLRHMAEEPDLSLRLLDAGWVVRAGRADPVHHFESPNRDRAHIWKQIARNGVLQGWMTTPWWMLPVHLLGTTMSAARVGLREGRLGVMMKGVVEGLVECVRGKVPRQAVAARTYFLCRWLRRRKPVRVEDVVKWSSGQVVKW